MIVIQEHSHKDFGVYFIALIDPYNDEHETVYEMTGYVYSVNFDEY